MHSDTYTNKEIKELNLYYGSKLINVGKPLANKEKNQFIMLAKNRITTKILLVDLYTDQDNNLKVNVLDCIMETFNRYQFSAKRLNRIATSIAKSYRKETKQRIIDTYGSI